VSPQFYRRIAALLCASFVLFGSLLSPEVLWAEPGAECLGPVSARQFMIYLHGLEPLHARSKEEMENRKVLEELVKNFSLRIALPQGPVCDNKQRCWPAKDRDQLLQTFFQIKKLASTCRKEKSHYSVLGFSNGGYFAWKLFKANLDAEISAILASGSAGTLDDAPSERNIHASFHLMIGDRDITLNAAKNLSDRLKKQSLDVIFDTFPGGHRLDYSTLAKVLSRQSK
jgi:predicted peptidase